MNLYKWMLEQDGRIVTAVQKQRWPVKVGEWTLRERPNLCESGWHGVEEKDVLQHLPTEIGAQLWEVEVKGKRLNGDDKFCAPQMRLVRLVGVTTEQNLRLFACDCAEDVLHFFEDKSPDDLRPRNAIETSRRYANGESTREELNAARDAAWDAAWAATWAAAWAATWAAARDAAWDTAQAATWAAARDAAWDTAWAKYSNWLVVRLESGY